MKKYNLFCPIRRANPYRRMAKAIKTSNYADNLLQREFECYGPRYVLLTDITYIPYNGEFAYLSTILDAYTKQILSYVLSASLEVDFVRDLCMLSPNEYYKFITTGIYPLSIANPPDVPVALKSPSELGNKQSNSG